MDHAHAPADAEPALTPTAATLTLFDPVIVEEVPIEWWGKVFTIVGYPAGLATKGLTHAKIIEVAPRAADNVLLLDFIQALHDLGSEDGAESILLAAQASGFSTEDWPANEVPRVRAVRLWVEQHGDERLRQLMVASQVHAVERGRRPPVYEFVGEAASAVRHKPKDLERAIEDAMYEVCRVHQLGTHVEARVRTDDDEIVCHIVHGSRLLQPMAETKEGGRRLLVYRPVQVDTVRYEFETARLKISCRAATLVPSIQELFGKVLFGAPKFFQNGEACTLEPLRRGEEALVGHDVSTIIGAKLVQASFRFGKNRLQMRGPDCFEQMKQIGFRAGESELYEGKIEIRFAGRKIEKRSVTVRAPNRIDFKRDSHEKDIERYLEQIGVRIVADKHPDQNLWTLHPWRHPLARWRAVFGGEADRACRAGILKSIGLEFVRRSDRPGDPTPIEVVDVGGVRVGVSADGDVGPRLLSDTDIQGMELDFDKLTSEIANSLSLVEGVMRLEPDGYADLGKRSLGSTEIRVFLMAREPTADRTAVARRIRLAAGTAHPVVIVPPGLSAGTGLIEVEQLAPTTGYEHVLRTAVVELGIESQVPAIDFTPRDRRLVVDEVFSRAWLDGVPLEAIKAGDQPYKLLAALAAAGGACVGRTELARILSPARADEGGPKMAKARLIKAIAASMKEAGKAPLKPGDILRQETGGSGYRLCLSCWYRPAAAVG